MISNNIWSLLGYLDDLFWYLGFTVICCTGIYFTICSKGLQFRILYNFPKNIKLLFEKDENRCKDGIHPLKIYFTSVGGMIGCGNVVGVGSAVFVGGPGSILWIWISCFLGMLLKYSETYLGVRYRQRKNDGYAGGSMYYLQAAFNNKFWAYISAILLCIYGVEIYQFVILVDRIETTFEINRILVITMLLITILYSAMGGVKRIANLCSSIMPVFLITYIIISLFVLIDNLAILPSLVVLIFKSAFSGTAAIGGFVGSSIILTAKTGIAKSVYSGDICVGFDSVVQSQTQVKNPKQQAELAVYSLFTDSLICFLTTMVILVSGLWHSSNNMQQSDVMAAIFKNYVPFSEYFMTAVLFFAGFTTIIAYFAVGMKAAAFLNEKYGSRIFFVYATIIFILFSNSSQEKVMLIMGVCSGLLLLINATGIFRLRKEIDLS
ncbi:MAG: amino acid carrier protein [Rickettsiaceae bacterium]|nr:amino acid carrier protein [Rickettsiaceae bacterium]